jgi:hypothetical protein
MTTISCHFLLPCLPYYPWPLSWPNKAMQCGGYDKQKVSEKLRTLYLYPSFGSPEKLNVSAASPSTGIQTVKLVSCPWNMNHSLKSQPEHQISWQDVLGFSSVFPDKCQDRNSQQATNISTSFPIHYSLITQNFSSKFLYQVT